MTPRAHDAINTLALTAIQNANLDRNRAKGDWKHMRASRLFLLLLIEVWELGQALFRLWDVRKDYEWLLARRGYDCVEYHLAVEEARAEVRAAREAVRHEAGDCCCFLAFLVDKTSGGR